MELRRSIVNRSVEQAMEVFDRFGVHLPPFAFWTVADWETKGAETKEIRAAQVFGLGCYRFWQQRFCEYRAHVVYTAQRQQA